MQKKTFFLSASLALLFMAFGITPQVVSAAESEIEEIIVTGSRIARDTFTTPAPVTVLNSEQIDAVGMTNIGEFLSRIPQTVSEINSSNCVFCSGSSGLQLTSLRNLGSQRTLTLVNGKRFVSGITPSSGYAVDLNAIPTALIERVEIKTGGTSAIYGSDAMAGVVNIILKDDFEGIEASIQTNQPDKGDRQRYDASLSMGGNFDRGNAWISTSYSKDEGMTATDRKFSDTDLAYYTSDALDILGLDKPAGDYWLGSSFPPGQRVGPFQGDGTPFRSGLADRENSDRFNRASFRDLASPVTRRSAAAGVRYEITDNLEGNLLLNYNQTEISTTFEPFPLDLISDVWDTPKGGTAWRGSYVRHH
ncbi:MAG: TonB-dependent receptor plug domain-containing protein, partial [Pseudomonadales bacterium]